MLRHFALCLLSAVSLGTEVAEAGAYPDADLHTPHIENDPHSDNDHDNFELLDDFTDAPTYFGKTVDSFDLDSIFIDANCYERQIDVYSDQLVAIEALRHLVLDHLARVDYVEVVLDINDANETTNRSVDVSNRDRTLYNKRDIEELQLDITDVEDCINRQ